MPDVEPSNHKTGQNPPIRRSDWGRALLALAVTYLPTSIVIILSWAHGNFSTLGEELKYCLAFFLAPFYLVYDQMFLRGYYEFDVLIGWLIGVFLLAAAPLDGNSPSWQVLFLASGHFHRVVFWCNLRILLYLWRFFYIANGIVADLELINLKKSGI